HFVKISFGMLDAMASYPKLAGLAPTLASQPVHVGIGIKPVSHLGTVRLIKAAIEYAFQFKRRSVTIVHKGNIMKYTEGAFRDWGYAAAEQLFGDKVYTWARYERTKAQKGEEAANQEQKAALKGG